MRRRGFAKVPAARAAREAAENAAGTAYADAVSAYAVLERDESGEAVRAVTSGRG
ncbi:hypothetical protein [Streptomyces sp. NPDC058632]|uniref:hypothetical protein n=1 Tax=Streptomyces sp. NPDC058632 TaxID=3346567 RepID=UPI003660AEAD